MWNAWGNWGGCGISCGGGMQTRSRTVLMDGANGGITCNTDDSSESRACGTDDCPGKTLMKISLKI